MSHNRDLSAAAAQLGFHSSNIGIGSEAPRYPLDVYNGNLLVSGSAAGNLILEDRSVGDSSRPFALLASNDGNFTITNSNRNASGTTTSSAERLRITSAGRIGINQASPDAMLQVDYDEGSSEVGLRLRAYNAAGSKTWQLSEINGTPGVFTIRNATNAQNNLSIDGSSGYVGVNATNPDRRLEVVETASSLTFPVAVSNHTDASAGVGAGIAFHLTAGGNVRGELGLVYAGNNNSDGTDFVFRPNDGSTGQVERLRITNDGKFGFNTTNPGAFDSGANHLVLLGNTSGTGNAGITISSGTDSYGNIYFADGTNGADAYRGHIAYNHNGNTMRFATNGSERLRIGSGGNLALGGQNTSAYSGHTNLFLGGIANLYAETTAASTGSLSVSNNAYINSSGNWVYRVNGKASNVYQYDGGYGFRTAGTGSAGGTISWTERFSIDSSGRVTKPTQPAFKCKLNGATGPNFTGVLVFTNVSYNIGSHYNTSNGRFTAPVGGRYLFAWYTNMERAGGNGSFYADWRINGNNQGNRMYTHHSGAWEQICGTVIFDLNANDYVEINAITSGNWDGGSYGSYSGCLLC